MILKQRQTFADPFLLKVVFPYLHRTNQKALRRLVGLWNHEVPAEQVTRENQHDELQPALARFAGAMQRSMRILARALQPQVLAPIGIAIRGDRRPRPTRGEG